MFAILLLACGVSEPPDVVLSEPPDIRTAAEAAYADVLTRVAKGETLTVAVGVPGKADVHLKSVPDTAPGLWRCFPSPDGPKMELVAAPEVARPKGNTFRNGDWHTGHDCPACGRQQLTIYAGGKYGPHAHRCPVDGTVWRHGG